MGNSIPEPEVNHSADLKIRTVVSRSIEPNEEAISNWNQSKRNKIHKHGLEQSPDNNKGKLVC